MSSDYVVWAEQSDIQQVTHELEVDRQSHRFDRPVLGHSGNFTFEESVAEAEVSRQSA